ncbi:MAG: PilZ domain-containing protein [Candidatus Omnitrophica bacterium]|nr:PilZ domain-containing protein [Candidatus Omnitrophota bacterium]
MKEKRTHIRCKHPFEIKCLTEDKNVFIAKCLDLSSGGIRIISSKTPKANEILELEIPLEKGFPPLKTKGKVVWQKSYIDKFDPQKEKDKKESGIQFLEIDDVSRRRIFSFIAKIEKTKLTVTRKIHTMTDMPF